MAVVPLLFRDWWDDYDFPIASRLLDQHFGMGLNRDDLYSSIWGPKPKMSRAGYVRPWHRSADHMADSGSMVNINKDQFEVLLDVQQFSPKEINVRVVDNFVVVEGKHEEKQDEHGFISRQFSRRYLLPDGVNPETVTSSLSSDGLLTVSAPRKQLPPPSDERVVPITHTGQAAKKDQPKKIQNAA